MGSAAVLGVLVQAKGIAKTTRGLRQVDSAVAETAQVADRAAVDMGQAGEKGGGRFAAGISKGAEKAKDAVKVGAAAIGAALVAGLVNSINVEAANDKLAAQLGVSGKRAKDLGKIAGGLYADAYGESLADVNTALKSVLQAGLLPEDATNKQIKSITAKVLDLSSAFDQDLAGSTRAVGALMRNGLAKDANQALDIVTRGFQQGVDKSGDYLDTLNEYSPLFNRLGLDGAQATGLLSQGLKAGARDADTVADALKEFQIRATDGSTASAAGFKALGLNAGDMTAAIAKGGPAAEKGLGTVLKRLREMEDPVERNKAAVALFGTKAEDLGASLFALDPTTAVAGLGQVAGAAQKMGDTLNDNTSVRLEAAKRTAVAFATTLGGMLLSAIFSVVAAVASIVGWFRKHETTTLALGAALGVVTAAFVTLRVVALAQMIPMLVRTAAAWVLMNLAMLANPVVLIVAALALLAAGLVVAWRESETFRAIVMAVWNAIKTAVAAAVAFIVPVITAAWNAIKAVTSVVWNAIKAVVGVVWAGIKAYVTVALAVITAVVTTAWTVIKAVTTTIWNVIKSVLTTVWAGIKAALTAVFNVYKAVITTVWNAIKSVTSAVWNAIKAALGAVWNAIKSALTTVFNVYKAVITAAWNAIKSVTTSVWNAIKSVITTVWNAIKSVVSSVLGWIKEKMGLAWAGLKIVTQNAWNTIKKYIIDPVRSAAGWVIDKIKWLADKLAAGFRSIWGIATDFAGGLRDRITNGFKGAVNAVGKFVNKIISVVNKIPGIPDIKYKFTPLAQGGQFSAAGVDQRLARGGMVSRPTVLVGEEGPCIARGTLIETEAGPRPIESVPVGARVLTRNGYRPVLWSGITRRDAEVLRVTTDSGDNILCTPDHRIWTASGDIHGDGSRDCLGGGAIRGGGMLPHHDLALQEPGRFADHPDDGPRRTATLPGRGGLRPSDGAERQGSGTEADLRGEHRESQGGRADHPSVPALVGSATEREGTRAAVAHRDAQGGCDGAGEVLQTWAREDFGEHVHPAARVPGLPDVQARRGPRLDAPQACDRSRLPGARAGSGPRLRGPEACWREAHDLTVGDWVWTLDAAGDLRASRVASIDADERIDTYDLMVAVDHEFVAGGILVHNSHPEYVIPTNPAYRGRATALMASAAQKMGMEGFARGGVLGNADTFASVAKKMGAGAKSTLALFMAGVVESGMRNLSYGDRDSRGILQIRDQTARGMGINNRSVAQSAAAFLGRGFWGKGSAMSLSKSGMSAGQVAQQTQGSAFPARYDQERGRALGYLKAARGDKKGLGDLLKGALSAVGDVASALNPMDFISKLPGVGDLPGWIQGLGKHALKGVTGWIKDKVASIIPSGGGGGGGGGSTTGLTDRVKDAVSYAKSNGWSGGINSGFRSKAKQQALYDAYKSGRGNLAAPPGNSNHERGLAVDVSQPDQFARAMGRMGEGRLYRKVPGEPWHFSTTGYARGGVLDGARKAMTSPFVGSYATGGIVPRDGMAKVHKGERVTPPGRSDGPMVHIENYVVNDARHDEERLARQVGFRMRALGAID